MSTLTHKIEPVTTTVDVSFLTAGKDTGFMTCKVIAVNVYPDHLVTFEVLVDGHALYSHLPPHALGRVAGEPHCIPANKTCYHACPDTPSQLIAHDSLRGPCVVRLRDHVREFILGNYVTTLDWPTANLLLHVIDTPCGWLCQPSHKVMFHTTDKRRFERFALLAKQREDWLYA